MVAQREVHMRGPLSGQNNPNRFSTGSGFHGHVIRLTNLQLFFFPQISLCMGACVGLNMALKLTCNTPVSYTHLDVYKRQVYRC